MEPKVCDEGTALLRNANGVRGRLYISNHHAARDFLEEDKLKVQEPLKEDELEFQPWHPLPGCHAPKFEKNVHF